MFIITILFTDFEAQKGSNPPSFALIRNYEISNPEENTGIAQSV
jgi:hypothetical protein